MRMDNFFEKLNKYLKKDDFAANLRKYSPYSVKVSASAEPILLIREDFQF